jgi:hypothetical protein
MRRLVAFALPVLAFAFFEIGSAEAALDVFIDKRTQTMEVKVDGVPTYHWLVSTGRSGYATPSGSFRGTRLEEVYYSKKYDNAPMPNAIFFTNEGHAIHGTYETKRLGSAVSHGCVRLAPEHAATLFRMVEAEGLGALRVTIVGSAQKTSKKVPSRSRELPGWQTNRDWFDLPYPPPPYEEGPPVDYYDYDWGPWN